MYNPEFNYLKKHTNSNSVLLPNEQKYYDKYINGTTLEDSNPRDANLKKAIRKKRLDKNSCEDMRRFVDLHGEIKIKRDIKKVMEERESEDQKEKDPRSEIVENMLQEQAHLNDWFHGASVLETTEYDDRFNHTDLVLEWENEEDEEEGIIVAVDATVAENPDTLLKKGGYIKKGLDTGRLAEIDYFESDLNGEKKILRRIPKIVMMLSQDSVDEICKVAVEEGKSKAFSKDQVQLVFIMEAIDQLKIQLEYIDSKGLKNREKIEQALAKFEKMLENKKSSLGEKTTKRAERDYSRVSKTVISLFDNS